MTRHFRHNSKEPHREISPLALAALFADGFSIDWLIELSGLKASRILSAIEWASEKQWLARMESWKYGFTDTGKKTELINSLSPEEQTRWLRGITDLLIREIRDESDAAVAVVPYLLLLPITEREGRLLMRAGAILRKSQDYKGSLECFHKVIDEMDPKDSEEAYGLFADAVIAYSKIVDMAPDFKAIIPHQEQALFAAKEQKDDVRTGLLELLLAKNEWFVGNYNAAKKHFDRGWEIAGTTVDKRLKNTAQSLGAFFLYGQGLYADVICHYEAVMRDIEKSSQERVPLLSAQFIGACYAYNGQITRGMGMLDGVFSYCRDAGDFFVGSYTGFHIGGILIELGRIDEAIQYLETAMSQAEASSNELSLSLSSLYMAVALYYKGDTESSVEYLKKHVKMEKFIHSSIINAIHLYLVLLFEMEIGKYPRVLTMNIEEWIRTMQASKDPFPKGIAFRYRALLDDHHGKPADTVLSSLQLSEKWLKKSGHEIQLAWTRLTLARRYLLDGNETQAHLAVKDSWDLLDSFLRDRVPDDLRFLLKDLRTDRNLLKEIMKTGQELVSIRNDQDLVQRILAVVNRITGAERSAVFLLKENPQARDVILRAARNLTEEGIHRPEFSSSMEMILETARNGEYRCRLMDPESSTRPAAGDVIRSCICVPMNLRDRVTGVLYADNRFFPSVFRESDIEILDYFAAQAAIALDNAAVHEQNRALIQILEGENKYLEEKHPGDTSPDGFVGACEAAKKILADVDRVSQTDSTVLILGETGTGKELIARAIHQNSTRRDAPFIRVNCSAFPDTLIAGELFGHEKGAFTGAVERHRGRFELADGGTLFLDEIGDISMDVQVRLLRVLQSHEFDRIGGKETLHSDFRLLTATNKNLLDAISAGTFREDLFYRLNVFPILIPPLRERKEDIPLLVNHFLKHYGEKMGKPATGPSQNDINRMIAYDWPGNVRELENIIERSVILSRGRRFLLPELYRDGKAGFAKEGLSTLAENERQHIIAALKATGGKVGGKGGAAELLDIHYNTLFSRMKKLGIKKTDILSK